MTVSRDRLLDLSVDPATRLVSAVRDDVDETHAILERCTTVEELHALAVVLACMVPEDRTVTQLLAWTHGEKPQAGRVWSEVDRRSAHSAYARGERTPAVVEGERAYQRARRRDRPSSRQLRVVKSA